MSKKVATLRQSNVEAPIIDLSARETVSLPRGTDTQMSNVEAKYSKECIGEPDFKITPKS